MRILVTNDDGINAPGIQALSKELELIGNVTVVAPDRERSATGHSITVHYPLRAEEICLIDSNVKAYAVDGTPSDCVKLAIDALLDEEPDLIVSGINRGSNLGTDVLYSGTVSAAIEGLIYRIPAIAVSCVEYDNPNYNFAAKFVCNVIKEYTKHEFPKNTILNVNVPEKNGKNFNYKITKLGTRKYENIFDKRLDPRGRTYYWLAGEVMEIDEDPETDVATIHRNEISITPIHFDLTNYDIIQKIKKWKIDME